ncbi:hypothetical protein [Dyadobacter sp. OTU695]|uniref:hypothetical protein n=1 Tax=Dyadobacter sp. OTU695 TaxID=3043860 RepID=UPI00313A9119
MKKELNDSLRLAFLAQYLNCCECGNPGWSWRAQWNEASLIILFESKQKEGFLYLRPLSSITDDEALLLCQVMDPDVEDRFAVADYKKQLIRSFLEVDYEAHSHDINPVRIAWAMEFLRSLGFAVPYMGHSVGDLVKVGWIKVVESSTLPKARKK